LKELLFAFLKSYLTLRLHYNITYYLLFSYIRNIIFNFVIKIIFGREIQYPPISIFALAMVLVSPLQEGGHIVVALAGQ
jgi:hypothetical protein